MKTERKEFSKSVLTAAVILLLVVVIIGFAIQQKQDLYISEVCSHNVSVMYDPIGCYSDYLILTNESGQTVDLEGYGLSDDKENLYKYVFPAVSVEPGESLTVWAAVGDVISSPYIDANTLYTNFKLRDHESIYLTNKDGLVIDSMRLPNLKEDQAYLHNASGRGWHKGTPSALEDKTFAVSRDVKAPVLSAVSGFYKEPFSLSLSVEDGSEIFYSLDGSDPKTNGVLYQAPLSITDRSGAENYLSTLGPISLMDVYMPDEPVDKATVIRAVARRSDGVFSEESCGTYLVGEALIGKYMGTPLLSMIVDPQDLFSHQDGIYVTGQVWENVKDKAETFEFFNSYLAPTNYNMRGPGWRRHADLTLLSGTGEQLYEEDAMVSIRGNYTRYVNQKSFSLFPSEQKTVFEGLFPLGGDTLVIRTGGTEDMFETNFRDEINNRICANLKVGAQQSVCTTVFLDGEYWGCYNLQDRLDESFVAGRYGVNVEDVNLIKNFEAVSGKKEDLTQYQELETFLAENDMSADLNYQRFCNMMDIDSLIDYYCAEIFFANDDAYDNNVALWRTRDIGILPYEDGKWRFLLFDTDCTDGYRENAMANVDSFVDGHCRDYNPDDDRFFAPLSQNAAFRERFRNRFMELLASDFSYERIEPILSEMENTYKKPMVYSIRRFNDPNFTEEQYLQKVDVVREFFRQRGDYLCNYLTLHLGN